MPKGPEERGRKNCPFEIWNCVKTGVNVAYGLVPLLHKNTFVVVAGKCGAVLIVHSGGHRISGLKDSGHLNAVLELVQKAG